MTITWKCSAILVAVALAVTARGAAAASAFMYVTVPPPCNAADPCALASLLVYDQSTLAFVVGRPLPAGTTPRDVAISPDGQRVYVSNAPIASGSPSITVIDALHHDVIGTFAAPGAGRLAVRANGSRLYIFAPRTSPGSDDRVLVWDTVTHATVDTISFTDTVGAIAAHPILDRFYVVRNNAAAPAGAPRAELLEYDGASDTLSSVTPYGFDGALDVDVSSDAQRIYAVAGRVAAAPASGGAIVTMNANTHAVVGAHGGGFPQGVAAGASGHFVFSADSDGTHPAPSAARIFDSQHPLAPEDASFALPFLARFAPTADESRLFVSSGLDQSGNLVQNTLLVVDSLTGATLRSETFQGTQDTLHFASTPLSAPACAYIVNPPESTWTVNGGSGSVNLTTDCAWNVRVDQPWVHLIDTPGGEGSATVPFTVDPNVQPGNRTAALTIGGQIITIFQAGTDSAPPFGVIDTPAVNGISVSGTLPVTGWVLDDLGVQRVSILRDPVAGEGGNLVFIGDATRIAGARPDVRATFPSLPHANEAGWGLAVLTNMLPNGGNGFFRIWAFAQDIEGHVTLLGTKVFTAVNGSATSPFGTIDTPTQGQTVSGLIVNFGWALTPGAAMIPIDGSTISVLIDGVVVGHPVYNVPRADVIALFPNYTNSAGPVGHFTLDTRQLADGVHTIAWVVTDTEGRTNGIGSRFFTVQNSADCPAGCAAPAPSTPYTLQFSGIGAEQTPVDNYVEAGLVVSTSGHWQARQSYGNPPAFIFFSAPAVNAAGEVVVTAPTGPFRFTSVDLYSSLSTIPYVITGIRNGVTMFTLANRLPNTFGNFATVSNTPAFAAVTIDKLVIRLMNPVRSNPMGIDNVVVQR